jgi:Zn-dependent protease
VLLHEFGHCFAARAVEGEADEVLLWPLGGLARCDVPHTPRANFITAAGGPAVNLMLCLLTAVILAGVWGMYPPLNPWFTEWSIPLITNWDAQKFTSPILPFGPSARLSYPQLIIAEFFWINWFLLLINVLLAGFPLDGGRMLQAALWVRLGYRQSMMIAVFVGFLVMLIVGIASMALWNPVLVWLALIIWQACKQELILLETGGEDGLFGYDFSQGYTSLEQDQPTKVRRKRQNFFQRWWQRRNQRKMQREMERAAAEERRMDELLEKIQRYGAASLTDEEQRFLKRVSDRYRNKN